MDLFVATVEISIKKLEEACIAKQGPPQGHIDKPDYCPPFIGLL
jgi:hypothetical protein